MSEQDDAERLDNFIDLMDDLTYEEQKEVETQMATFLAQTLPSL